MDLFVPLCSSRERAEERGAGFLLSVGMGRRARSIMGLNAPLAASVWPRTPPPKRAISATAGPSKHTNRLILTFIIDICGLEWLAFPVCFIKKSPKPSVSVDDLKGCLGRRSAARPAPPSRRLCRVQEPTQAVCTSQLFSLIRRLDTCVRVESKTPWPPFQTLRGARSSTLGWCARPRTGVVLS